MNIRRRKETPPTKSERWRQIAYASAPVSRTPQVRAASRPPLPAGRNAGRRDRDEGGEPKRLASCGRPVVRRRGLALANSVRLNPHPRPLPEGEGRARCSSHPPIILDPRLPGRFPPGPDERLGGRIDLVAAAAAGKGGEFGESRRARGSSGRNTKPFSIVAVSAWRRMILSP